MHLNKDIRPSVLRRVVAALAAAIVPGRYCLLSTTVRTRLSIYIIGPYSPFIPHVLVLISPVDYIIEGQKHRSYEQHTTSPE